MAKKRAFASDSDVSRSMSRKQNPDEATSTKERQQVTIYPNKDELEHVKILAKVKDLNLNSMLLALIRGLWPMRNTRKSFTHTSK